MSDTTREARAVRPDTEEAPGATKPTRQPAYVVVLIVFLFLDAFSGNTAGLPLPVSPDRVAFALLALLVLLDARIDWRSKRPHPAVWVALVTAIWITVSAAVSGTLTSRYGLFALLDRVAIPYLLFAFAPWVFATRRSRVLLLQFLTVLGLYLGFTAIFEIVGPRALVYPRNIVDSAVGITVGRARGPFLASDADAAVMGMCLFAAGALFALAQSRVWRRTAAVSVVVCLVGVLLAFTRSEWIGTALGLIIVGLLTPQLRRRLPALLAVIIIGISAILVVSPSIRSSATDRASTSRSVYDRTNTNDGALRALDAHPLFGIGWTRFLSESDNYVRQARTYPLTNTHIEVHNVPLGRLAELGLLGGGLWILSVLVGPVAALFQRRRSDPVDEALRIGFVGVATVWLTAIELSPFPYALPNALVWLMAGLVLSPLSGTTSLWNRRTRPSSGTGADASMSSAPSPRPRHLRN